MKEDTKRFPLRYDITERKNQFRLMQPLVCCIKLPVQLMARINRHIFMLPLILSLKFLIVISHVWLNYEDKVWPVPGITVKWAPDINGRR